MWSWLTSSPQPSSASVTPIPPPSSSSSSLVSPEGVWDPLSTPVQQGRARQVALGQALPLARPSFSPVTASSVREESLVDGEFELFSLLADFRLLAGRLPPSLYVLPSSTDDRLWNVTVFVGSGPFSGAVLLFELHLSGYPVSCPRLVSRTRLFHPAVDPVSGHVSSAALLPVWRPQAHRVWHLLSALHASLLAPGSHEVPERNPDAALMLETEPEVFLQFCRQCAKESRMQAEADSVVKF